MAREGCAVVAECPRSRCQADCTRALPALGRRGRAVVGTRHKVTRLDRDGRGDVGQPPHAPSDVQHGKGGAQQGPSHNIGGVVTVVDDAADRDAPAQQGGWWGDGVGVHAMGTAWGRRRRDLLAHSACTITEGSHASPERVRSPGKGELGQEPEEAQSGHKGVCEPVAHAPSHHLQPRHTVPGQEGGKERE